MLKIEINLVIFLHLIIFIYILYFIFSHFADTNNTINNKFSDIISLISYIYIYILFI